VNWNSAGDGAFTDGTMLTASYSPGPADIAAGYVNLFLTANAIAPCTSAAADTVHIILDPCLGLNNHGNPQFSLSVFPNPSEGRFMLNAAGITAGQVQVRITAMDGRTVYSETLNSTGSDLQKRVDLGGYPSGIYFVSVTSGSKISAQRFILQK
jgi:hypothetical protein